MTLNVGRVAKQDSRFIIYLVMERESEEHWPPGLKPLLEALSWAVFENTPENILQFASDYCCKLLHFRAENPSLDLDTLIQEFSRSECVKFSTKSNTSSAEDSINDTISSSTARLPSVDLVKEHGFERTWSATGFSFTSGLIDPESTHSTAVFQRKTDQETAGLLGTTSEEGHQVPSALFERVSLHEISSGVDAVLIKTSRLPSESVIMAQTEEIPEVIVFQTAKNKAKDAKSQTLPPFQQLYTAHHFSQHPAGASTGPPVNTRPANTFQERVDFPNYNHRPGLSSTPASPAQLSACEQPSERLKPEGHLRLSPMQPAACAR
ncbi:uncharacterized protein [Hoplias malabaricus]|uniref:uncharacterized protein isoform X2 n=1 Tax=Hoplias malabaricus TaxID=27720 RepID=UPI003461FE87